MEQKSKLFSVDFKDRLRAAIMGGLVAAGQIALTILESGSLDFNIKAIAIAFLSGSIGYLLKNFLTNSKDQGLAKEPK